jgi:inhibitor of cysteine peptidase
VLESKMIGDDMRGTRRDAWRALLTMIALATLTMVFLSGCSKPAGSGGSSSGTSSGPLTLTQADADKTVTVSPGQTLEVVLDANPSTGYTWTIASAPEFLKSQGDPKFASQAESGVVGAGGKQTLEFAVTAAGKGELSLNYVRPWETGAAPAETFKVQVEAK